ncbi:hypothetical protein ACFOD1_12475 [Pseudidiomarina halophila]|uniref:Uncharacterized protein n=1 Tax=Pseudidiomarina halophila TaxID=1449799 RepID=A0A432XVL2_9GAMM|nr:hypothetical protein [Pseudidiomarina halophila]RUO52631.1 hypothetical protein CWI69_06225 [Pseudidiomarina halophila]
MKTKKKELNRRINALIAIAFVVFIIAAKLLLPHEEELKEFGALGATALVVFLSLISYAFEVLLYNLISNFKRNED